jgi:hypothetical protein
MVFPKNSRWIILVPIVSVIILSGYMFHKKKMQYWLVPYLKWELANERSTKKPVHIMLYIVDHFEPTTMENMKNWTKRWPGIVKGHQDADGVVPQYTWAYFLDGYDKEILSELAKLAKWGYGEIEIQLHHSNDTPETFRQKLREGKRRFHEVGAALTVDGKEHFAYVAGNWALDNSIIRDGRNWSGVNSELKILREEGCFADVTMPPAMGMAMPKLLNVNYYAKDDPQKNKSYATGKVVQVGGRDYGDLMILQGPLSINIRDWRKKFYPDINTSNIQASDPPDPLRIDEWVRVGIHVKEKPEWVFIKLHTHGAHPPIRELLLSDTMGDMFSYFESHYNDGREHVLHYVTAREAYNIVKAAEAGKSGNPNEYRNFIIQPYQNNPRGGS